MAFTEQDATGLIANANAYIGLVYFRAYVLDRGTDHSATTDADLQTAIIQATDYVDTRFRFKGLKLNAHTLQTTEWPRRYVYDRDSDLVEGIPVALQEAIAELALLALTQSLYTTPAVVASGGQITREKHKIGPIEDEWFYANSGAQQSRSFPDADRKLLMAGLIDTGGGQTVRA